MGYSVQSPLARELEKNQSNCSWPVATWLIGNEYGLGSHLHQWTPAACNAHEYDYRLRTNRTDWLWLDQAHCSAEMAVQSPFLCYFPAMEHRCGVEASHIISNDVTVNPLGKRCSWMQLKGFLTEFRAAALEHIFQQVSPLLIQESERQIGLLFGSDGVPEDMITVHIRWGDKHMDMTLVSIDEYNVAISQILQLRGRDNTTANIYLSSEDPQAVREFMDKAPPGWNVYTDRSAAELDEFRPKTAEFAQSSLTSRNSKGRAGLGNLGSLLVALEANSFVLTTRSNWSRLINELRKNVLDAHCGNCTKMIDLRPFDWR